LLQSDDINAPVRWINIAGIHNQQLISSFGKIFGLHPLVQEDIMHAAQRPKLEDYDQYLYLVLRMISLNDEKSEIRSEQVSIILFQNTVITFQENPEDIFDSLRERIKKGAGRIRKTRADYLAYCLIDSVVDHYFEVLERIGEKLEDVEEAIISNQFNSHFNELHNFKRELIFFANQSGLCGKLLIIFPKQNRNGSMQIPMCISAMYMTTASMCLTHWKATEISLPV
jgi:magnesium transporter